MSLNKNNAAELARNDCKINFMQPDNKFMQFYAAFLKKNNQFQHRDKLINFLLTFKFRLQKNVCVGWVKHKARL